MIALGLLLAASLATPGTYAHDLNSNECREALEERLDDSLVDLGFPTQQTAPFPAECRPSVQVVEQLCPKGSVGVGDTCLEGPELPRAEPCEEGKGVVLDAAKDREACVTTPGPCPNGATGIVVDGIEVCTQVLQPQEPNPEECSKTDDDFWPGGSHVKCTYACPSGSLLRIRVDASDLDATTQGYTRCADKEAHCSFPGPHCEGYSEGVTAEAGDFAACHGYTDEANSSPVTVACAAISLKAPAGPALCHLYPPLCNLLNVEADWVAVCTAEDPQGIHHDLVASLSTLPPGAVSGVTYREVDGSIWSVAFSAASGAPSCTLGVA